MMGSQQDDSVGGGSRTSRFFYYQRLERQDDDDDQQAASTRRRWWWLPALDGKAAPPCCFLHVRTLKWSRIASALLATTKKVAELSSKIRRADGDDDICQQAVIFMSPWGLPVLSRPLLARNKKGRVAAYPHRHAWKG
jgi:hypothetical protein